MFTLFLSKTRIWVNYNDLTATKHWESLVSKGNHPQMAEQFRSVECFTQCMFMYFIGLVITFNPQVRHSLLFGFSSARCHRIFAPQIAKLP